MLINIWTLLLFLLNLNLKDNFDLGMITTNKIREIVSALYGLDFMFLFQKSVAWDAWRKKEWMLACSDHSTQGMVGHATHPSTPEAGRGGRMLHKFKASMVFRGSSKPVRTTQWDSYKHTKKGCQHILKSSLPKQCLLRYWFPSEGKSVIIMQKKKKTLICLLLLFCFYLKQKKNHLISHI